MRKLILIPTVSLIVIVSFSNNSNALIPVLDLSSLGQQIKSYALQLQGVQTALDTFHEAQGILRDTTQTLNEVTGLYNSVTGVRSIGQGIDLALGQVGGDPLPFSLASVSSLMTGRSPIALINTLGTLGGAYNTNAARLRLWTPSDPTTDAAQNLEARIGVTAAASAVAEQQFTSAQKRMPLIKALADQIANAKDGAEREALMVRLQGASAVTQAAVLEALATQQMASAAKDADAVRQSQQQQQSLHQFNQEADAIIAGRW